MSAQQRRGQQIYLTGTSPSAQKIQARLTKDGALLPAALIPCVNCHKYNGKGGTEGGVTAADIRWFKLSRPYGLLKTGNKSHPPYTQRSIKKAISMGTGSAGQALNQAMPRYQLSHQDMRDLIAYLTGLGTYQSKGISDKQINIGVILPRKNPQKSHAVKQILNAYFTELNQQGGIYQRQIQLLFIESPTDNSKQSLSRFRAKLKNSPVFAFVASHLNNIDTLVADFAQSSGIPIIGAFSPTPQLKYPLNRYIFYLMSGQSSQIQALKFFRKQFNSTVKNIVFIDKNSNFNSELTNIVQQEIIEIDSLNLIASLKNKSSRLKIEKSDIVFLLLSEPAQSEFFNQAAALNWWPNVLIPGSQMNPALFNSPDKFNRRIFIALPNLPLDYQSTGLTAYQNLQKKYPIPSQYRNSQLLAIAAAKLLKEGLIRTGRQMEQEKLIDQMESLYKFNTQLTRPISYGPNRRSGTNGAYIIALDLIKKTIIPASDWLEVE